MSCYYIGTKSLTMIRMVLTVQHIDWFTVRNISMNKKTIRVRKHISNFASGHHYFNAQLDSYDGNILVNTFSPDSAGR